METSVPVPTVGGVTHFAIALAVFFVFLIVGLAALAGLRSAGYDPVGRLAAVFVSTPKASQGA